jgi:hypothetical protein
MKVLQICLVAAIAAATLSGCNSNGSFNLGSLVSDNTALKAGHVACSPLITNIDVNGAKYTGVVCLGSDINAASLAAGTAAIDAYATPSPAPTATP